MNEGIMSNPVVIQIILEAVYQFFFVFGLVGIAVGIGLVFSHARMQQLSRRANQWVSMRRSTKWLAIPCDSTATEQRFRHLPAGRPLRDGPFRHAAVPARLICVRPSSKNTPSA